MTVLRLALIFSVVFCQWMAIMAYEYCAEDDIKNICDTHLDCDPEDMCQTCKCYQDAWDCSHGGYGSCKPASEYYSLGKHGGSEYLFSMRKKSWDDAEAACQTKRGHLAILATNEESDALKALIEAAPKYVQKTDLWLGGKSDAAKTAPIFWADGSSLARNDRRWRWRALATAYGDGPHCTQYQLKTYPFQFCVSRCSYSEYYICEVPAS